MRALAGAILFLGLSASSALATPAGVPDAPIALYSEDFEDFTDPADITNVGDYDVPGGDRYQADERWDANAVRCNGFILSFSGNDTSCAPDSNTKVKALARKVGVVGGDPTPDDNHALAESSDAEALESDDTEIRIPEGATLPLTTTYFVMGADSVAVNCELGAPLLTFTLQDASVFPSIDHLLSPAAQNACDEGADVGDGMRGAKIWSDASVYTTLEPFQFDIANLNDGIDGNDHALDNIVVADARPQLDQGFASTTATTGGSVDLTFTITNTSDLASKDGWSFDATLPEGLTVDGTALRALRATTNCAGATITAPGGGSTISATGGLANGQSSCTVTVAVRSASSGTFVVAPATPSRLRPPGPASVTFNSPATVPPAAPPAPPPPPPVATPASVAACADGIDNDGDGLVDRDDPGCQLNGVYAPQKDSEATASALAQCERGALRLTDVFARNGRTVLRGVAGPSDVGKTVSIVSTWNGKVVARAKVRGDLSFSRTAKLPPRSIRATNRARFQARLGNQRSRRLKFSRRMPETTARRLSSSRVRISGRVTRPLAAPVRRIIVRGSARCRTKAGRGTVLTRSVKVKSNGRWSATITLPKSLRNDNVFLRGETRVPRTRRSGRTSPTYTLIQGVALK